MTRKPCRCGRKTDELAIGSEVWVKSQKGRRMLLGLLSKDVRGVIIAVSGQNYTIRIDEPTQTIIHTTRNQITSI